MRESRSSFEKAEAVLRKQKQFWVCLKHLHSKQSCDWKQKCEQQNISGSGLKRGCRCLLLANKRRMYPSFKSFTYWWSCTLLCHCTLTELYKLKHVTTILPMKWNKTYWSTLCLLVVPYELTDYCFSHVENISTFSGPISWIVFKYILSDCELRNKTHKSIIPAYRAWSFDASLFKEKRENPMCWCSKVHRCHYWSQLS